MPKANITTPADEGNSYIPSPQEVSRSRTKRGGWKRATLVKVIAVKAQEPQAWQAYQAMLLLEKARPELTRNPVWIKHRDNCYADWFRQFEVA